MKNRGTSLGIHSREGGGSYHTGAYPDPKLSYHHLREKKSIWANVELKKEEVQRGLL